MGQQRLLLGLSGQFVVPKNEATFMGELPFFSQYLHPSSISQRKNSKCPTACYPHPSTPATVPEQKCKLGALSSPRFWHGVKNRILQGPSFSEAVDQPKPPKTYFSNVLSVAILGCGGACDQNKRIRFLIRSERHTKYFASPRCLHPSSCAGFSAGSHNPSSGHPDK